MTGSFEEAVEILQRLWKIYQAQAPKNDKEALQREAAMWALSEAQHEIMNVWETSFSPPTDIEAERGVHGGH